MTPLYRLNAIQNELRDVLALSQEDYRLEVSRDEVGAAFIGLKLRSAFQPIVDQRYGKPLGYEALLRCLRS